MKYDGRSQTVKAFLVIHADVADAIHAICPTRGEGVYENHSTDALECLLGTPDQESGPLDHLLGLRVQEHIRLFGRMTFIRAAAREHGLSGIVEEYAQKD